jgi:hypothetical protein
MTYLPYIVGTIAFLIALPSLFVVGLLVWHLLLDSLPHEEQEMPDEKPKQYRKALRTDPPALVRIKELGWYMPCGHHAFEWSGDKQQCLQCVLEGRVASRDMGRR